MWHYLTFSLYRHSKEYGELDFYSKSISFLKLYGQKNSKDISWQKSYGQKNSKHISWQKSYGQKFWLQTCLQWPLPREVTPLDEPVECGDASPMGKAAAMFTARMTLWAWNLWSSNKSVSLLKSLKDIINVTLVMMTKSFILPNFLKLLKRIFIYTKCCFDDFINVTLVCDDNRLNAHKIFNPY